MSTDDSDKTVFKQPMPGGDRTSMRPAPGARNVSSGIEPTPVQPRPQAAYNPSYVSGHSPIEPNTASFKAHYGLNPIVNAASTLIAVFAKTRSAVSHPDVSGLHQRLIGEIKTLEAELRDLGLKQEVQLSVRYLMCSVLDEAVLNTPWGTESAWAQRTLLSVFHGETSGGEKSFLILDRLRQSPSENLDVIELFYICLSLGFEGRYRLMNRGREALDQVRDELFSIIRRQRGDYERTLSPAWSGLGRTRNPLTEYIPLWVVVTFMAAILFFSYSGLRYWLYASSSPVADDIAELVSDEK
ncbi:type IVB secretion system protein IcmH/DotU [Cellvibrio sp. PSBB023]|uniref:type IVB secretion system protein IcmH/DotU n=1 Tax=Cellvibrio sp. PSBB023 TaxID=1945512 RepID=UPI0009C1D04D|nr:type IVB secretion system protein IcmH/DotU [Cellvibrio sp. PSBB023]AQT61193.1 type IV secretion protein DotU [Cellvibrio sp. PSBB023]